MIVLRKQFMTKIHFVSKALNCRKAGRELSRKGTVE